MSRSWPELSPRYLEATARVVVRFQEVDSMGVVWHGHYLTFFEEGRAAFGEQYGFSYQTVFAAGLLIPVVKAELDYLSSARFGDVLSVVARLHPEPAARLQYSYEVRGGDARVLARGRTLQVFTDREGAPLLTRPPCYEAFLETWQERLQSS